MALTSKTTIITPRMLNITYCISGDLIYYLLNGMFLCGAFSLYHSC